MQKNLVVKILIILALAVAAAYFIWSFMRFHKAANNAVCKKISIEIANGEQIGLLNAKTVMRFLQQHSLDPVGKSITDVCAEAVETQLRKNPSIRNAECYFTPSGEMKVNIVQRQPKFRVMGCTSFYVDTERKTMPLTTDYSAYVPVVSGRLTISFATHELYDFVDYIENDDFWNAQIEQIYVSDNNNIELVPRIGDAIIKIGELKNYAKKLDKLKKLYAEGFDKLGWNKYCTIDLRYDNQIVCARKTDIQ